MACFCVVVVFGRYISLVTFIQGLPSFHVFSPFNPKGGMYTTEMAIGL